MIEAPVKNSDYFLVSTGPTSNRCGATGVEEHPAAWVEEQPEARRVANRWNSPALWQEVRAVEQLAVRVVVTVRVCVTVTPCEQPARLHVGTCCLMKGGRWPTSSWPAVRANIKIAEYILSPLGLSSGNLTLEILQVIRLDIGVNHVLDERKDAKHNGTRG